MFRSTGLRLFTLLLVVLSGGCKKQAEPVEEGLGLTSRVSFSNTVEVLTETEVDTIRETGRVEADLNLDNHPDLVIMRVGDDDNGEVEVFLRKPPPPPEPVGQKG